MRHEDYPALFLDADRASNLHQKYFLRLIIGEYVALFLASVFSLSFLHGVFYHVLYAGALFIGLVILLVRAFQKPEQWWYRCRALAESVKTLTWRYMMRATPFEGSDVEAKTQFRDQLHAIFRENSETARQITADWSGNAQVTDAMTAIRSRSRNERLAYYMSSRVGNQREWYRRKAQSNRRSAQMWVGISAFCYVVGGAMALSRIALPTWAYWPIEPLIVVAASIVGWVQIKKFNELSAAYKVTAHEIGLIQAGADGIIDDAKLSEFVNDAEKAFSREHTLWLARQSD
ncbi:DUF4231 domain-containing protein [Phreatobacter oligotrophus]|uniref:DUF4231 domain-containing protein n=1 Tax=Phreatobacter oligotrophus TaxID=1122261 RepID=UPI002356B57F|nr:DUF4231 domain-containing protein [Phreatobacter oligotrophus]MBX9991577.1 DUF4231 domain-containing protein [Phreatobacter oligotrophus]